MKENRLLLLAVIFFIACNQPKSSDVSIKGTITNNAAKSISIGDSLCQITETGSFLFKRVTIKPQFLAINYQDKQFEIFVEPDEHLEIFFDAANIDSSIVFTGISPESNLLLFKQNLINEQVTNYFKRNWYNLFSKDEHAFIRVIDSLKSIYLKPLDDLLSNNINEQFAFVIKNRITFSFDKLILDYPRIHKDFTDERVIFSRKTRDYLSAINLDNPDLIDIDGYTEFGKELLDSKVRQDFNTNKALKKSDNQWLVASFNEINQNIKNRAVIDFWYFQYLYNHIENLGIKNIAPAIESFNKTCLTEELKTKINSLYNKALTTRQGHLVKTYKTIDGFELDAHIFIPDSLKKDEKRPAVVYFHGGSWNEGKPDWQFGYSKLGFINICIENRLYDRHGALPFEQISDAKSAIRWLRENADEFHIDANKIIANGNSAGGHLALSAAMLDILDEPTENKLVSSKPDALILNSAIYDLQGVWFEPLVNDKKRIQDISPTHNIHKGLPPMLVFHGTDDVNSSPYFYCRIFVDKMKKAGNDINFYPIENVGHALWSNGRFWQISNKAKQEFYLKLGYL